jgi:hypothetical protein
VLQGAPSFTSSGSAISDVDTDLRRLTSLIRADRPGVTFVMAPVTATYLATLRLRWRRRIWRHLGTVRRAIVRFARVDYGRSRRRRLLLRRTCTSPSRGIWLTRRDAMCRSQYAPAVYERHESELAARPR